MSWLPIFAIANSAMSHLTLRTSRAPPNSRHAHFQLQDHGKGPAGEQFLSMRPRASQRRAVSEQGAGLRARRLGARYHRTMSKRHFAHYELSGSQAGQAGARKRRRVRPGCLAGISRARAHERHLPRVLRQDGISAPGHWRRALTNFKSLGHFGINVPNVQEATEWAEAQHGLHVLGHSGPLRRRR